MKPLRLMFIDNAESTPYLPLDLLPDSEQIVVEHVTSAEDIELSLQWFEPDVVLFDFDLGELQAMQALDLLHRLRPGLPLVMVCDQHDDDIVFEALRCGAFDCVPRNNRAGLLAAVTHAVSLSRERRFRAAAERGWQESEMRFHLFMEHMPAAVYMKDLDGRFTYVNSAAKRLIGPSAGHILGKTLHQLFPSEVADRLSADDDRALRVRQPIEAMEQLETPNGPRVFRSIKFPIIGMDGLATMTGGFSVEVPASGSNGTSEDGS